MGRSLLPPDPRAERPAWARRSFLSAGLVLPALWAPAGALVPTPACADPDDAAATPAATEGPFYTARSPERSSLLEPGAPGTPIELTGRVFDTHGRPIPRLVLDFWHADTNGEYDRRGYRYRGHQWTDAQGRYGLRTIVPSGYGGRTRHYHVKLLLRDRPLLTTQLFFPEDARNQSDILFDPALVMHVTDVATGRAARFDFVVAAG